MYFEFPPLPYILLFSAGWYEFEEYACVYIYINDGRYYAIHDAHYVYSERQPEVTWEDLEEISEDEVYELMEEWKDVETT